MISHDFWQKKETKLFLNPRISSEEKAMIEKAVDLQNKQSTLWLRSSGTESLGQGLKLVAIEFDTFLAAAQSVNQFYQISSQDIWLNPLPIFHVGGLSISARCFLAHAQQVILEKWDPIDFYTKLKSHQGTVTSLVPTQLFDLVKLNLKSPECLRLVIVGGGAIDPIIFNESKKLGWPISPSYGMTETSALIAGMPLDKIHQNQEPQLKLLSHVSLKKMGDRVAVDGKALFSGYLWVSSHNKPIWQERPEPFIIDDRIEIDSGFIKVLGRESELVKILGETVNLNSLKDKIKPKIAADIFIKAQSEPRRGFDLYLFVEGEGQCDLESLNQGLMPFEKIKAIIYLDQFPRTELGKIKSSELKIKS